MRVEIKLQRSVDVCDFCGISYSEHREQNLERWKNTTAIGFCSFQVKVLGWVHTCPDCENLKKYDEERFEEVITLLISSREKLEIIRKEVMPKNRKENKV